MENGVFDTLLQAPNFAVLVLETKFFFRDVYGSPVDILILFQSSIAGVRRLI